MKKTSFGVLESFFITLLIICLVFIFPAFLWNSYDRIEADIPSHQNQLNDFSSAALVKNLKNCTIDATPSKLVNSCEEAESKLNNYIKEKRDLNAQEGMWRAATELLKLTTIQLVLLILSTIGSLAAAALVYRTFLETIKTNDISNKALRESRVANTLQLQPWISLKLPVVERQDGDLFLTPDGAEFLVNLPITNDGETPAINLHMHISEMVVYAHLEQHRMITMNCPSESIKITSIVNPRTSENFALRIWFSVDKNESSSYVDCRDLLDDGVEIFYELKAKISFADRFCSDGELRAFEISASRMWERFGAASSSIRPTEEVSLGNEYHTQA